MWASGRWPGRVTIAYRLLTAISRRNDTRKKIKSFEAVVWMQGSMPNTGMQLATGVAYLRAKSPITLQLCAPGAAQLWSDETLARPVSALLGARFLV